MASKASQTAMMRAPAGMSVAAQAVGVAGAVEVLVARAHEPGDVAQGRGALEDALADERVTAHELPLVRVERAALARGCGRGSRACRRRAAARRGGPRRRRSSLSPRRRATQDASSCDALAVPVQRAIALLDGEHERLGDLAARPDAAPGLVLVHADVGAAQRVARRGGLAGEQHDAVRGGHGEPARRGR